MYRSTTLLLVSLSCLVLASCRCWTRSTGTDGATEFISPPVVQVHARMDEAAFSTRIEDSIVNETQARLLGERFLRDNGYHVRDFFAPKIHRSPDEAAWYVFFQPRDRGVPVDESSVFDSRDYVVVKLLTD